MARIGLRKSEPFDVDLWDGQGGGLYVCKPATRSITEAGRPLIDEFEAALNAGDEDRAVEAFGQVLDLRLSRADGKTTKVHRASEVVKRKWKADEVTVAELVALAEDIDAEGRPT